MDQILTVFKKVQAIKLMKENNSIIINIKFKKKGKGYNIYYFIIDNKEKYCDIYLSKVNFVRLCDFILVYDGNIVMAPVRAHFVLSATGRHTQTKRLR